MGSSLEPGFAKHELGQVSDKFQFAVWFMPIPIWGRPDIPSTYQSLTVCSSTGKKKKVHTYCHRLLVTLFVSW